MSHIVAFGCSKGGSGKTTVTVNLGVAMSRLGKNVVILDADVMMANLGLMLGLEGQKTTLHDVLAGEAQVSKAIHRAPEGVRVVPGGVVLEGVRKAKLERLKQVVQFLEKKFEYVLVDVPSGLDRDAITAMSLATHLVLVVTPDIAALSNSIKTKLIAEKLGLKLLGVIVTRAKGGDSDIPEEQVSATLDLPVLATIPEDAAVRHAASIGEPVVTHSPKSTSAMEFKRLALNFRVSEKS
ncbi:MAG: cell division ATPase MinD [Candidatus Hadarchaeota archaeon]